jgi:hypothetical protein
VSSARPRNDHWVLVTDGGDGQARSTLATVRALALGGYHPAVTVSGRSSIAAASRRCERAVRVPPSTDMGYAEALRAELETNHYLTVIATSDAALSALGEPVEHLIDKGSLTAAAAAAGIPTPPSTTFGSPAELRDGAEALIYPVVVKPPRSRYPARRVDTAAQLRTEAFPDDGPVMVQPFLTEPLRAVAGVAWRGEVVASVHMLYLRTWPPECGGACAAVTEPPDLDLERRVLAVLDGREGMFMAQFAGPYLLDLNPRAYGSIPLAVAAGANLPVIHCDLLRGLTVAPVRARPGVFYRSLEGDLRHFLRAVRRRRVGPLAALRQLRPRRGAAHGPESIRDPAPMLARARHALGRKGRIPPSPLSGRAPHRMQ